MTADAIVWPGSCGLAGTCDDNHVNDAAANLPDDDAHPPPSINLNVIISAPIFAYGMMHARPS